MWHSNCVCAAVRLMPSYNLHCTGNSTFYVLTYALLSLPGDIFACIPVHLPEMLWICQVLICVCDYKAFLSMHIFKINTAVGVSELFFTSPLGWIWSILSRVEEIPSCSWGERNIKTSLYFCYCEAVLHPEFWHKCAVRSLWLSRLLTQPRLPRSLHPPGVISALVFIMILTEALSLLWG